MNYKCGTFTFRANRQYVLNSELRNARNYVRFFRIEEFYVRVWAEY